MGGDLTDFQQVTAPDGSAQYLNYAADPGVSGIFQSLWVGTRETGAIRFITNEQGQTYLFADAAQSRIDGLGLSVSLSDRPEAAAPLPGYDFNTFNLAPSSLAASFGSSPYVNRSITATNGVTYISRDAAMRAGVQILSQGPSAGEMREAANRAADRAVWAGPGPFELGDVAYLRARTNGSSVSQAQALQATVNAFGDLVLAAGAVSAGVRGPVSVPRVQTQSAS